jgi:cytidylate kinase
MAFQNHISITADSGVGSTTTAKKLHQILGYTPWRWVNAGAIMRIFAKERGMTIEEFAAYMNEHTEEKYDERCDRMIEHFGEHDYVIFEGRLVHFFAPQAFHVRLVCDPRVRAERRAKDAGLSVQDMYEKIVERDRRNAERYLQVYGSDCLWPDEKFDLVLDTGVLSPDTIAERILSGHAEWAKGRSLK